MRGATAAIGAARSIRPSRWYVASLALVGEHSGARSLAWTRPIATANARASLLTTTEKIIFAPRPRVAPLYTGNSTTVRCTTYHDTLGKMLWYGAIAAGREMIQ